MLGTLIFAQLKIAELLSLFVQLGIFFKCFISILYNFSILIILQIFYKSFFKQKSPLAKCKGLIFIYKWWRLLDDFRDFCINDETEKVYKKLEEVINT